jgi:hypothetical protein
MNSKSLVSLIGLLLWTSLLAGFPEAEVFHRPDFRGEHFLISGEWTAHHRRAPWNDAINAIIVPRGYEAILYEHAGFRGARIVVRGDWSTYDAPNWRNRISSIQIIPVRRSGHVCDRSCAPNCRLGRDWRSQGRGPAEVLLFQDTGFRGPLLRLTSDWSPRYSDDYWNDNISSIRVPRGYALIVYEHAGFQGRSFVIRGNWSAWGYRDFWNDRISSVRLVRE